MNKNYAPNFKLLQSIHVLNNEKITIKELLTIDLNTNAKNLNIYITTTCI